MKKIIIFLILLIFISNVSGAFKEIEQGGAYAISMGNAIAGLADNIDTIFINPAGIANIKGLCLSFSGASLYPGLDYGNNLKGNVAGAYKMLPFLAVGAGYGFLYTEYYAENIALFSTGFNILNNLNVGANFKYLMWGGEVVSIYGVTKEQYNANAIGYDLGILYAITGNYSAGLSILDINQPVISSPSSKIKDRMPFEIKIGLGYNDDPWKADVDFHFIENMLSENIGVEYYILENLLAMRGGLSLYSLGSDGYQLNIGVSINAALLSKFFQFNYAFGLSSIKDSLGIHNAGIQFSTDSGKNSPAIKQAADISEKKKPDKTKEIDEINEKEELEEFERLEDSDESKEIE